MQMEVFTSKQYTHFSVLALLCIVLVQFFTCFINMLLLKNCVAKRMHRLQGFIHGIFLTNHKSPVNWLTVSNFMYSMLGMHTKHKLNVQESGLHFGIF